MAREHKGKSIDKYIRNYVVLDVETTGLSPSYHELIEFACVRVRDGKIVNRFETLIKPSHLVNSFITSLTGISNNMLIDAPNIDEVIDDILSFIGDDIIVGHNVNFDINFIYEKAEAYRGVYLSNDFIDTMKMARRLFPYCPNHKLDTLSNRYNTKYFPSHRAMNDVLATYELIEYMFEQQKNH